MQAITFRADRKEFRSIIEYMHAALRCGRTHEAISVAQKNNDARVKQTNALHLKDGEGQPSTVGDSELIELAKQSLECSTDLIQSSLRKKQNYLATVSATAPLVGLFGTVMHIATSAFAGCGAPRSLCDAATASAVADSLWIAGLGMVVAFVALCFYRYFNSRIEDFAAEVEISSLKFLSTLALGLKQRTGSDAGNRPAQAAFGIGITFDREIWLRHIKTKALVTALIFLIFSSECLFYIFRPTRQPPQSGFSKFYFPLEVMSSADDQPLLSPSQCRANVVMPLEWTSYVYTLDQKGGRWPFGCNNLRPDRYYYFGRWTSDDHGAISVGVLKWSLRWHMSSDHIIEENDLDNVSIWTLRLRVPE